MVNLNPISAQATAGKRSSRLRKLYRAFRRQPNSRLTLVAEATVWLALSRLALVFVPFRVLAAWFGTVATPSAGGNDTAQYGEAPRAMAREVGWAVTRSARYVPFRAVCLPQAIAAKAMLDRRRIGSVMHFGVARSTTTEPIKAHAWLDAAGVEVTGFPIESDMIEIARFL